MKNTYCCQCGKPRKSYEKQMEGYEADIGIVNILDYRKKVENLDACNEISPQLIGSAFIRRNGGTDPQRTHICNECLAIGLRKLKSIIDRDLAALEV